VGSSLCITVVEDNESLCAVTVELLRQQGHRAVGVTSAEALSDEGSSEFNEVMLVDLNLPGEDGLSLLRRYRQVRPDITLIVVSSRDRIEDRLACYEAGADAFIGKPTDPAELLAVINAQARRRATVHPAPEPSEALPDTTEAARLDTRRLTLTGPAGEVAIAAGAAKILSALALAPGKRLEYWQLIDALGEDAGDYTMAALAVRIVRLRQLLRAAGLEGTTIRSLRSEGYVLCVAVTVV